MKPSQYNKTINRKEYLMEYDTPFASDNCASDCPCHCTVFQCCSQKRHLSGNQPDIRNVRHIQRTFFLIWSYLMAEGIWDEAADYISEHSE